MLLPDLLGPSAVVVCFDGRRSLLRRSRSTADVHTKTYHAEILRGKRSERIPHFDGFDPSRIRSSLASKHQSPGSRYEKRVYACHATPWLV